MHLKVIVYNISPGYEVELLSRLSFLLMSYGELFSVTYFRPYKVVPHTKIVSTKLIDFNLDNSKKKH